MRTLIYYFELFLIFAPGVYYQPALETNNLAVIVFSIIVNIAAILSVRYILKAIKEDFRDKPT